MNSNDNTSNNNLKQTNNIQNTNAMNQNSEKANNGTKLFETVKNDLVKQENKTNNISGNNPSIGSIQKTNSTPNTKAAFINGNRTSGNINTTAQAKHPQSGTASQVPPTQANTKSLPNSESQGAKNAPGSVTRIMPAIQNNAQKNARADSSKEINIRPITHNPVQNNIRVPNTENQKLSEQNTQSQVKSEVASPSNKAQTAAPNNSATARTTVTPVVSSRVPNGSSQNGAAVNGAASKNSVAPNNGKTAVISNVQGVSNLTQAKKVASTHNVPRNIPNGVKVNEDISKNTDSKKKRKKKEKKSCKNIY